MYVILALVVTLMIPLTFAIEWQQTLNKDLLIAVILYIVSYILIESKFIFSMQHEFSAKHYQDNLKWYDWQDEDQEKIHILCLPKFNKNKGNTTMF
jgi:hypothetical protein